MDDHLVVQKKQDFDALADCLLELLGEMDEFLLMRTPAKQRRLGVTARAMKRYQPLEIAPGRIRFYPEGARARAVGESALAACGADDPGILGAREV